MHGKIRSALMIGASVLATFAVGVRGAQASWNDTKWGMSVDQIRTLYPTATLQKDPASGTEYYESTTPVQASGVTWTRIAFRFESGGLSEVILNAPVSPNDMRDRLISQFGAPIDRRGARVYFKNPSSGDTILLNGALSDLTIIQYQKPSGGF